MTALTKVRRVKVQNYEDLNEILVDIQIDEGANIIGPVPNPLETREGFIFTITYHIKDLERENNANRDIEEITQES